MDKGKIKLWIHELTLNFKQALLRYPVEYLLFITSFIWSLFLKYDYAFATDNMYTWIASSILIAYILNTLCSRSPNRLLYYIVPVIFLVITGIFDRQLKLFPPEVYITTGGILAAGVALCRTPYNDHGLVRNNVLLMFAFAGSLVLCTISHAFLSAIYESVIFLFNLKPINGDFYFYELSIVFKLLAPLVLFGFIEQTKKMSIGKVPIFDTLLNYIVTPAILLYLTFLYIYMIKIGIEGELPEGGVAYMVLGFSLITAFAHMFYPFVGNAIFSAFYRHAGWFLLPPLVLFWIGVMRRINDFGLTEARIYLVISGALLTIYIFSLFRKAMQYRYGILLFCGITLFGLIAYIPALRAERFSVRSQANRVKALSKELGLLSGENGTIRISGQVFSNDSIARELYESLKYIRETDSIAGQRLISETEFIQVREYVNSKQRTSFDLYFDSGTPYEINISSFNKYYGNVNANIEEDVITLMAQDKERNTICKEIKVSELYNHILTASGKSPKEFFLMDYSEQRDIEGNETAFIYKTNGLLVVFFHYSFTDKQLHAVEVKDMFCN